MKKVSVAIVALLFISLVMAFAAKMQKGPDPLKVGPEIYKLAFENEKVRVLEVHFAPGVSIGEHWHPDHLAYIMTAGKLQITAHGGKPQVVDGKPGMVIFIKSESHSAKNLGETDIKILVVELKK